MGQNLRFSPLEWDEVNKIFNFGGYGATGLLLEALTTTGNVFYVDNSNGQAFDGLGSQGKSPSNPLKTIDYAIGRCTANNGDIIIAMPGHAENVSSAAAITFDVAGVKLISIGDGADRPTLTFNSTDNSAYVAISADSVGIYNILGVCGDDALTKAFYVTGADCTIDITWRDPANVEAARCVLGGTGADRLKVNLKYEGDAITGNACVAPIQLNGTDGAEINVNFFGIASTAVVNFITNACTNIVVKGYAYNAGVTDYSKLVVDTVGTSNWAAEIFDGAAGHRVFGGSGGGFGTEDLSTVVSDLIVVQSDVKVVISDYAALGAQVTTLTSKVSDLTILVSDLTIQASNITTAVSDFTVQVSDISSDLTAIETDTAKISSDLIVSQSDLKSTLSDLKILDAIVDAMVLVVSDIGSDVTAIEVDTAKTTSDLIVTQSDVKAIGSDLIVTNAIIDTIASDLVSVNARVTTIASDIVANRTAWNTFETIVSDFVVKYTSDNP